MTFADFKYVIGENDDLLVQQILEFWVAVEYHKALKLFLINFKTLSARST